MNRYLDLSPEVREALENNRPVVALESTIISHGMPYPKNVQTAVAVENTIRQNGAVPATIAIIKGRLKVGLIPDELEYFGKKGMAITKTSRRDIPVIVSKGLRRAIISLGREGAFCYEVSGTGTRGMDAKVFPNLNVVSTNGCGDVLLAGFLRAMSEGFPLEDSLWYGQAASGINAESMEAVSPALSFENVRKKVEEYYEQIS